MSVRSISGRRWGFLWRLDPDSPHSVIVSPLDGFLQATLLRRCAMRSNKALHPNSTSLVVAGATGFAAGAECVTSRAVRREAVLTEIIMQ